MITPGRRWFVAGLAIVLLGAGLWLAARPAKKLEVKLFFVGFTNGTYIPSSGVFIAPDTFEKERTALVVVTNTGTAAAMVYSALRAENSNAPPGFAFPDALMPPTRLEPGKAFTLMVTTFDYHQPWFTELLVRRARWQDQTLDISSELWAATMKRSSFATAG